MPPKQKSIIKPHLLFVEGTDDFWFFVAVLEFLKIESVQIVDMEGKDNISEVLGTWLKTPGYDLIYTIGVVRDAEQNPLGVFESVKRALGGHGLPVPTKANDFVSGNIQTGILIMPSATETGMLEDILLQAAASDPVIPCVDAYLACLQEKAPDPTRNVSKARFHSFLASRKEPGLKLGEAVHREHYFDLNHAIFAPIKEFVRALASIGI